MITIELIAAIDAAGTTRALYFSTAPLITQASDTPANTAFLPAVKDPGSLGVSAYGDGRTGGNSALESGEIVLVNTDGRFDAWIDYSFEGRAVTIRAGEAGAAYPAGWSTLMTATVDSLALTDRTVTLRLRDKQLLLDTAVLVNRYAGTNVLPNGLEGVAGDLKDKPKPRTFGAVTGIAPPCVNTSKLTYQVNDGAVADIVAVYDRGVSLTKGADFATSALLQAASPAASTYITCFAEGYFRLGSAPAGLITADVTQGAAPANRTTAQTLKALALIAGVAPGDVVAADVTALDSANSAVIGLYIDDDRTARDAMDQVAASVGAFYGFDPAGGFRMGLLTAASGTPVLALEARQILSIERRSPKDNGVPVWSATVRYGLNYSVQTSDIATAVTAPRRAIIAAEYRAEKAADAAVKSKYLTAGELTVDTLLSAQADAATEAARQLALYKVRRDIFDVTVPLEVYAGLPLNFMDVVSITHRRYGLASGKSFRLLGRRIELARRRVTLTLWG